MSEMNALDNRPLARSAIWFLVEGGIVLAVLCGVLLHPEFIPEYFAELALRQAGTIAMTLLFTVFVVTASVLGFLANCRAGRTTGATAIVFLFVGWIAIGAALMAA